MIEKIEDMISPTLAKQEVDIISRLLEQSDYSDSSEKVELLLSQFEGKHFRHLSSDLLLKRVKEVATKLKSLRCINNFHIGSETDVSFDIKGKKTDLEKYKRNMEYEIGKAELQVKIKKGNRAWLIEETKTFYFMLPTGIPKAIPLWTARAQSDQLFMIFKVLFNHWEIFHEQVISKSKIITELDKLGYRNVSDYDIKNSINNLRDTKIKPAELSTYITISYDRNQKGYKLVMAYP